MFWNNWLWSYWQILKKWQPTRSSFCYQVAKTKICERQAANLEDKIFFFLFQWFNLIATPELIPETQWILEEVVLYTNRW